MGKKTHERNGHYSVDGIVANPSAFHALACKAGFNGSKSAIRSRLLNGVTTMAELCKPVSLVHHDLGCMKGLGKLLAKSRATCAAAISEVDARRKQIADRMKDEEE